ncbi:hypothetical protein JW865_01475 [Candidatus Bathyarchaeota archaeon]|nr:hypothetical protein [Candidatus Bathyarchaeota archaeon]
MSNQPFHLKIRIGDTEVELSGIKSDVLETINDLPIILNKINDAFHGESNIKSKQKKQVTNIEPTQYPQIPRTTQCSEAVTSLLAVEWGKTPRTISELREAMEANAIFFPKTTLSGVLVWLVKKGTLRRYKDKKRGYLYTMNIQE